jgi:xanthine dehydrogenase accessory factor
MTPLASHLAQTCLATGTSFAVVVVQEAAGSTPREQGAVMVLSALSAAGTIGGGRLEWVAIEAARDMLVEASKNRTMSVVLGPESGQCCGGRVVVRIEKGTAAHLVVLQQREQSELAARPAVFIHGAGHVGRALAAVLALLPFKVVLVDSRAGELALARDLPVECVLTEKPVAVAEAAPAGAAHVILTHSHALDSLIAVALLERETAGYIGIIGSKSKKALFRKAFRAVGISEAHIRKVVCPIGGEGVKDKRPAVIAVLVAAEITQALLGTPLLPRKKGKSGG